MSVSLSPSSACQINGGRSSIATVIPTWFTGLLVIDWIARSGPDVPRNSQISPVRVSSSARCSDTVLPFTPAAYADCCHAWHMEVGWTGGCRRCGGGRGTGRARPASAQCLHTRRHSRAAASTIGRSRRGRQLGRHRVKPVRAGKSLEFDVSALVERDVVAIADRISHHLADQNLATVRLACHARRHCDVAAEQVVAAAYRLAHVNADPDTNAVGPPAK